MIIFFRRGSIREEVIIFILVNIYKLVIIYILVNIYRLMSMWGVVNIRIVDRIYEREEDWWWLFIRRIRVRLINRGWVLIFGYVNGFVFVISLILVRFFMFLMRILVVLEWVLMIIVMYVVEFWGAKAVISIIFF